MSEQDEETLHEKVKYELLVRSYSPTIPDLERDLWNDAYRPYIYLDDAARAALDFARSYANEARIDELENRLKVQFIPSHWERLCGEVNSWAKYVDRRIAELEGKS